MFLITGIHFEAGDGNLRFQWATTSNIEELKALEHAIRYRISRFLERRGLLVCDAEIVCDAETRF